MKKIMSLAGILASGIFLKGQALEQEEGKEWEMSALSPSEFYLSTGINDDRNIYSQRNLMTETFITSRILEPLKDWKDLKSTKEFLNTFNKLIDSPRTKKSLHFNKKMEILEEVFFESYKKGLPSQEWISTNKTDLWPEKEKQEIASIFFAVAIKKFGINKMYSKLGNTPTTKLNIIHNDQFRAFQNQ